MSWTKGVGFLRSWRAPSSLFQKVAFRWMATLEKNLVTKKNFLKMAIVHLIIWPNINRFFKFLPFQIYWLLIGDLCQNFSCQTDFLPAMVTKMVTTWSAELWYCISDRYYKIIWFNQQFLKLMFQDLAFVRANGQSWVVTVIKEKGNKGGEFLKNCSADEGSTLETSVLETH